MAFNKKSPDFQKRKNDFSFMNIFNRSSLRSSCKIRCFSRLLKGKKVSHSFWSRWRVGFELKLCKGERRAFFLLVVSHECSVCVCTKIIDKAGGQIVASGENVLCYCRSGEEALGSRWSGEVSNITKLISLMLKSWGAEERMEILCQPTTIDNAHCHPTPHIDLMWHHFS